MKTRVRLITAVCGLAVAPAAMAQFTITPGGANAGNGVFSSGALAAAAASNLTGTGNATANFRATTGTSTDNMFQSSWWFRGAGDTREFAFGNGTSGALSVSGSTVGNNAGTLDTGGYDFVVANAGYSFLSQQRWQIFNDGVSGVQVVQTNTIVNTGVSDLTLALFSYNDFDPAGSFSHPYSYSGGQFTMTSGAVTINWAGFGADARQSSNYSSLRTALADTSVNNLNGTDGAAPGDFTGAFQWNLVVPVGGSATVIGGYTINGNPAPAPGALALLGLGGAAAARRRRR